MRVKYVLNEVLIGLWRNATMTIAMIITLAVSLTMLGAGVLLYAQVDRMKDLYYGNVEVKVFLNGDATDAQRDGLGAALRSSPMVRETIYESKAEAFARFREMWSESPDLIATVRPEQLPASFRVKLRDPEGYREFAARFGTRPGVDQIIDQRQLLEKVFDIFAAIQLLALAVAAVMAMAALLLVGNTIQLAAYSKRQEVAVMRLVGASNWFIQAPFVLEAMVAGVVGAVLGFGALFAGKTILIDGRLHSLIPIQNGDVWLMLPLMAVVGAAVSAVTAWITLRFYLRV
ncbi:permease-like cell division protein FtsX [Amorphoplanes digitatis]|uniref:Cell division protein FtsX n=1 Tax=Actinoplanes digitatis TaxID=1868 RepID=A0A7W7MPL3_9ACTN|nr:permease-like cell division protein FtsX [Actinoplanes digitatis]MBB4761827.1 cell division transport system permease protein [Actinoplanes digitatis]BFE70492.1 permease-like cell division protein FtsX [Actinoplanes digitatis]GID90938.1 cell division protein FtsX [Actinoplanes digitatis]